MCRCCRNGSSGDEQGPTSAFFTAFLTLIFAVGTVGCFYGLYTDLERVYWYLLGTVVLLLLTILACWRCIKIVQQYNQRGRPK